jgi:bifunctional non-homologous end joining protein LigD
MGLREYVRKRDFKDTSEPKGKVHKAKKEKLSFVIQEHHATRLHFDFRLEMAGVLKSWAVPKGPSMNPNDKRLAMMVEDHPIEYGSFAGSIPEGNYGAGEVRIWDKGWYEVLGDDMPEKQVKNEKIIFVMHGKKLKGEFHLFRMKGSREENAWLLFKAKDKYADTKWKMEQILDYGSRKEKPEGLTSKKVWISNRAQTNTETAKAEKPARKSATSKLLKASKSHAKKAEEPATKKLTAKSATAKKPASRTTGRTKAVAARKTTGKAKPATKRAVAKKPTAKRTTKRAAKK